MFNAGRMKIDVEISPANKAENIRNVFLILCQIELVAEKDSYPNMNLAIIKF